MWIVYFWDADPNGISAFVNKRRFDTKKEAQRFAREVNGRIETRPVFA